MAFGIEAAKMVQSDLNRVAPDVKLFFDEQVQPQGIWVMCQVQKNTANLILPKSYMEGGIKPYILYYLKDEEGRPRLPDNRDVMNIIAIRSKAEKNWKNNGNDLADRLEEQDQQKDERHRQKQKDRIHAIAPAMKKAIKKENY